MIDELPSWCWKDDRELQSQKFVPNTMPLQLNLMMVLFTNVLSISAGAPYQKQKGYDEDGIRMVRTPWNDELVLL